MREWYQAWKELQPVGVIQEGIEQAGGCHAVGHIRDSQAFQNTAHRWERTALERALPPLCRRGHDAGQAGQCIRRCPGIWLLSALQRGGPVWLSGNHHPSENWANLCPIDAL